MANQIVVQIADMKMSRRSGTLITYALGSCVGISLYDPVAKLGALIHIMLPQATTTSNTSEKQVYKFADTGIASTLLKMSALGGMKSRYVCKIAGGAKMFSIDDKSMLGSIGDRNVETVMNVLRRENIRISGQDTGSNYARTMTLDVETGKVSIRTIGKPDINI